MNGIVLKKLYLKNWQVISSADAATITDYMTDMVIDMNWAALRD